MTTAFQAHLAILLNLAHTTHAPESACARCRGRRNGDAEVNFCRERGILRRPSRVNPLS
jgi:hypothetical protein